MLSLHAIAIGLAVTIQTLSTAPPAERDIRSPASFTAASPTAEHRAGPAKLRPTRSALPSSPTNRAPAGYVGPQGPATTGLRVTCPGSTPEGEPTCSDEYDDVCNGGCNSTPPVFQTIASDAIILGESGTFLYGGSQYRDTDWYEITITEGTEFTWNVTGDFDVLIFLIQNNTDTPGDCSDYTVLRSATADAGEQASITMCCDAGTYWFWAGTVHFIGVPCGSQYCAELICTPCTPPPPAVCPPERTLIGQDTYDGEEAWSVYVSNDRFPTFEPADGVKRIEHFCGVAGQIDGLSWWGISAVHDDGGYLIECPLDPGGFLVEFYRHDPDTERPDYDLGPLITYTADAAHGLRKSDTGYTYVGEDDEYTLWYWEFDLPVAWTSFEGWLSIKNLDYCPFWWAASPAGDGLHVQMDDATDEPTDADGDLAYCLTAMDIGPFTGACCDESEGVCRDTTADDCCGPDDVFYPGLDCAEVVCNAEPWACCLGPMCSMMTLGNCVTSAGYWFEGYVCTTDDPKYTGDNLVDCQHPPPPPITCYPPIDAFGTPLSGGYLYWSHDYGPGDQHFLIDNYYCDVAEPITMVRWWGNSAVAWEGPDCDFAQPAPFVIKFYPDDGTGVPDVTNPTCEYDPGYVSWTATEYYWSGAPELGMIERYVAYLAPSCNLAAGWISIAATTPDCDFIWAPGAAGDGVQYHYDNGTLTPASVETDRSLCLYTIVYTGACCYLQTGTCVDNEEQSVCLSQPDTYFEVDTPCADLDPPCAPCEGACCNTETDECYVEDWTTCEARGLPWEWLGCGSTCDDCCVTPCPPEGIPEGEPTCFDGYVDTYNAGCDTEPAWSYPDNWLIITEGQTYCAETGTYTTGDLFQGDLDWYEVTTADPSVVRAHVTAEDAITVTLVQPGPPEDLCDWTEIGKPRQGAPCDDVAASAAVEPGTYWYFVAPPGNAGFTCGTPYLTWLEFSPAGACEAFLHGEQACKLASENVCLALGGYWLGAGTSCACYQQSPGDCNCDGLVNTFDIDPFVLCLTNQVAWQAAFGALGCDAECVCDCDHDGHVNTFDIDAFVQLLTGG